MTGREGTEDEKDIYAEAKGHGFNARFCAR
jgi:uncharacterized protein (UPF0335 family)